MPQPLHSRKPLLLCQEPRRNRRVGHREAEQPEQKRQRPGEQVDILPSHEPTSLHLRKPVVQRSANDGEESRAAEPPALPQTLLRLRVVPRHDAHESRGDNALHES